MAVIPKTKANPPIQKSKVPGEQKTQKEDFSKNLTDQLFFLKMAVNPKVKVNPTIPKMSTRRT